MSLTPDQATADLAEALKLMMDRDELMVPPYPGVAMRLQQLVSTGNYGVVDLVKILGGDPTLAAATLRYANSAALRGASEITTLPDAVSRLGAAEVVKIALASTMGAESTRQGPLGELRRRAWQESLTSAFICFLLAQSRRLSTQEAFACGLLHDFGRIVALASLEALLKKRKDLRVLLEPQWLALIHRFHVEVGMVTAKRWKLPDNVRSAIACHHEPGSATSHGLLVDIVATSDQVVQVMSRKASIRAADLDPCDLRVGEAALVVDAVGKIGAFVSSLAEAAPTPPGPAIESQVARPEAMAGKRGEVPLALLRNGAATPGKTVRLAPEALSFVSAEKLQPGYLAKLRLEPKGIEPFEVLAQVVRCCQVAGGFETDGKLFALGEPARGAWERALQELGGGARAA